MDAVKSAAMQDYPNKEIYIVDDCSTDNTKEVMGELPELTTVPLFISDEDISEKHWYNIHGIDTYFMVADRNGGPSRARNIAIKKAAANGCQLFAILDADDIWKQGKLSKSVVKILENPEIVGGVYTDYQHYNVETNTLTYESKEPFSRLRLIQDCIVHSGCVINGLVLQRCGLYDEDLRVCEDYNLWLRISNFFMFVHIPEDLVIVRVQPNNSTNTVSQERWQRDYQLAKQRALG
jgi:glycosyltransferase involved in cell wall biosynthesis